ncbi:hypothetical protein ACSNOJ_17525 [Streptomyces sp. URMC 128]|uniref:hypothetical protein n=1 Tax=Streptomyces sp. URMC 128 TaxID=3423404 RepID=UPI003F1AE35A
MQPIALVSTSDTGVMSSNRSEVNIVDLWPARLEPEPLGGDERPVGAVVAAGLGDPARQQGGRLCLVAVPDTGAFTTWVSRTSG